MEDLFELLKKHTSKKGNYTLHFNEHKGSYENALDYHSNYFDDEDFEQNKNIDWEKDIYNLVWYKNTPVGSYDIFGNSLDDILRQVKEIIGE